MILLIYIDVTRDFGSLGDGEIGLSLWSWDMWFDRSSRRVRKLLDFARGFWNWDGWFWVKIDGFKLSENLFCVDM